MTTFTISPVPLHWLRALRPAQRSSVYRRKSGNKAKSPTFLRQMYKKTMIRHHRHDFVTKLDEKFPAAILQPPKAPPRRNAK
jgi:hypothetical protein